MAVQVKQVSEHDEHFPLESNDPDMHLQVFPTRLAAEMQDVQVFDVLAQVKHLLEQVPHRATPESYFEVGQLHREGWADYVLPVWQVKQAVEFVQVAHE